MKPFLNPKLLDKQQTYVVGVSFGPDSMALLHLLVNEGFSVHVAHVNYHLRPESNVEQSGLEQFCFTYDIPLHVLDVKSLPPGNLQHEARRIRYDFFALIVSKTKASAILTAHHQDDDLETALMQSQRGEFYEYYGIRPVGEWQHIPIIRPLLDMSKLSLIEYCQSEKVPYLIDQSNLKPMYQRNRLRSKLARTPLTKKLEELGFFKEKNEIIRQTLIEVTPLAKKWIFPQEVYQSWSLQKQFLFWTSVCKNRGFHLSITYHFLEKVMTMIRASKPNIDIKLAAGWNLFKSYQHLYLLHQSSLKPFLIKNPLGVIKFPLFQIYLPRIPDLPKRLIIRSCRADDKVVIQQHHKSFRRLAIDWKMPSFFRKIWPVLTTEDGKIFLIPRYHQNLNSDANNWLEILE